MTNEDKHLRY